MHDLWLMGSSGLWRVNVDWDPALDCAHLGLHKKGCDEQPWAYLRGREGSHTHCRKDRRWGPSWAGRECWQMPLCTLK